jgi:hypothetical protein
MALIQDGYFSVQGLKIPIYQHQKGLMFHTQWSHYDGKEIFVDLTKKHNEIWLPSLKLATHEHSVEEWWGLENGLPAFKCRLSIARISIFGEIDTERGQLSLEFAGCEISHSDAAGFVYLDTRVSAARTKDAKAVRVRASQKIKAEVGRKFINGGYYLV